MTSLCPAKIEDKVTIDDLMQPYLGELAAFTDDLLPVAGRYDYPYLDHYWQDSGRFPFLILSDDEMTGFILVREDLDPVNGSVIMEVAELFILEAYRRRGLAERAVTEVWGLFRGQVRGQLRNKWRVCVLKDNQAAYQFWRPLIAKTDADFAEEAASAQTKDQTVFTLRTG